MAERRGPRALEAWCRRLVGAGEYPGVRIDNMTSSWRDGRAFCALVHRFRPDLIDFESLKPEDIYYNNELAFRMAETHLGIPALLDPEDMVDTQVPDRLSILTYLSQFYQRLGHTVTKTPSNDNNNTTNSPRLSQSPEAPLSPSIVASLKLGKSGYERCIVCDLPVYLAQRLLVSHKLYHRRCFRCSTCNAQLTPANYYENSKSTEFCCETCKNKEAIPKSLRENDDRMGMVMFHDEPKVKENVKFIEDVVKRNPDKPPSVLDRISIFEQKEIKITKNQPDDKLSCLHNKDDVDGKGNSESIDSTSDLSYPIADNTISKNVISGEKSDDSIKIKTIDMPEIRSSLVDTQIVSENSYKSNVNKLSFLQTQLSTDPFIEPIQAQIDDSDINIIQSLTPPDIEIKKADESDFVTNDKTNKVETNSSPQHSGTKRDSNVPDDVRLEDKLAQSCTIECSSGSNDKPVLDAVQHPAEENPSIIVPPRRRNGAYRKSLLVKELDTNIEEQVKTSVDILIPKSQTEDRVKYPDDLNPFSEDEDEDSCVAVNKSAIKSTNPFGSSDDDDDNDATGCSDIKTQSGKPSVPRSIEKLTPAPNPFWSDGEEPSDEEAQPISNGKSRMSSKSALTTSTPNLLQATPRRSKPRAPRPPVLPTAALPTIEIDNSYSFDDAASLSSMSSHCSTINSDYKLQSKLTPRSSPRSRKKRPAPTPPDCASIVSTGSQMSDGRHSLIKGRNLFTDDPLDPNQSSAEGTWRRVKGPAPGLPLPGRRVVRPELSATDLQTQLDLLETQQSGLERQGVLIEQMIREKCEGEDATPAPQEEVEELVIQLCELVNEKNDLFRKQAELMYIRRQQRLEQEQADIEHEIRIIQSRPTVNRIDADKAREEYLVGRLMAVVRLRDELVQQLDSERRREVAEDAAIADSIAQRRAKRNSDSNHSSLQSEEVVRTPKKSKVKDRVKKQLKKAKNTLNPKKKESEGQSKEKDISGEKETKSKWF